MTERLLAYMVTRNEAPRYLDACLAWAGGIVDDLAVYDDRSDDFTAAVATRRGGLVAVRPRSVPSFLQHEGRFRAAAWSWFEQALAPAPGDWVLAIDADEFLVSSPDHARAGVDRAVAEARATGAVAALIEVPEVFAVGAGAGGTLAGPQVRVDGAWATIAGTRLFAYRPGAVFRDRAMGCGAEPTYVADWPVPPVAARWLHLLHLGYAHPADREAKYRRYTTLVNHGHASAHIESIMAPASLRPWSGPWPPVWRGGRA